MAGALVPVVIMWDASTINYGAAGLQLIVLVALGAAVMLGGAAIMRSDELRWLIRRKID